MQLSRAQSDALAQIDRHLNGGPEQMLVMGGVAGSGKTTIIKEIASVAKRSIWYLAPTAKAASVMMSKLPEGAVVTTAHSFLYRPIEVNESHVERADKHVKHLQALVAAGGGRELRDQLKSAQWHLRQRQIQLEKGGADFIDKDDPLHSPIILLDEASQCDEQMETDLRLRCDKIIAVGDPFQLPPVNGTDFFDRNPPDIFLDEVHRQAKDSTILRFATAMRRGESFNEWDESCRRIGGTSFENVAQADVVITGMNDTRRKLNSKLREVAGHRGPLPRKGEPIMVLRNDHARGLINGVGGVATTDARMNGSSVRIGLTYQGEDVDIPLDPYEFYRYTDEKAERSAPRNAVKADYGYAITCHKAQGSEWPHVLVWDDKMRSEKKEERKRWIYTAITRAQERLTWVQAVR